VLTNFVAVKILVVLAKRWQLKCNLLVPEEQLN